MSAKKSSSVERLNLGIALLPLLLVGGCADYLSHQDNVTSAAGDAVAFNKTVHIADPWPQASRNTRIGGTGQRVDVVTKRYLAGPPVAPSSSGGATVTSGSGEHGSNAPGSNTQPSQ